MFKQQPAQATTATTTTKLLVNAIVTNNLLKCYRLKTKIIGERATDMKNITENPAPAAVLKTKAEKTLGTKWVFSELHSMTS